jgi:hypothetical protein
MLDFKTRATRQVVADDIARRLNIGGVMIRVFRNPDGRFSATAIGRPEQIASSDLQAAIESIVEELRLNYVLVDEA